jgi:hypothetical protein
MPYKENPNARKIKMSDYLKETDQHIKECLKKLDEIEGSLAGLQHRWNTAADVQEELNPGAPGNEKRRFTSVTELKAHIATEVAVERDFEQELMHKYPDLWPRDAAGNVRESDCGAGVPVGWETLVDNLCGAIDHHIKTHINYVERNPRLFAVKMWVYKKCIVPVSNLVWRLTAQTDEQKTNHMICRTYEKSAQGRTSAWFRRFQPHHKFNKYLVEKITVAQIKQKFGSLRFYYDGNGDDTIRGMVQLAEYISSHTCEITGNAGSIHKSGEGYSSWYRALSETKAKEMQYHKPTTQ